MHVILGPQPSARFLAVSLSFVNSLHKSLGKRPRIALHATLTRPDKLKRSNTLRNLQGHRSERCWGPERMEISLVTSWSNAPAPGRRVSCKQRMEQRKERLETVGMWHHNCLGVQDWSEQTLCNQGYQKKKLLGLGPPIAMVKYFHSETWTATQAHLFSAHFLEWILWIKKILQFFWWSYSCGRSAVEDT